MLKWLILLFSIIIITFSIAGIVYPNSLIDVVINPAPAPTIFRFCLAFSLISYLVLDLLSVTLLNRILSALGLSLISVFVLYASSLLKIEIRFFDVFFIIEGGILALIAGQEQQADTLVDPEPAKIKKRVRMPAKKKYAHVNKNY